MSILIKGTNLEDLQRAMLMFIGHEIIELPNHGDLIEKTYVVNSIKRTLAIKSEEYLLPAEKVLFNELCNAPVVIPAEKSEDHDL